MIALVTGATGFIGGALAAALGAAGWEVRVLVRPSSRGRLAEAEHYRVFEADLARPTALLEEAAADCDVVFHAASIRDRWGTSAEEYRRANIEGTRHLLAAATGRATRFVYVSSVGVLGWPGVDGIDESFPIDVRPGKADYHGTKAAAEQLVRAWPTDLKTVVVRPTITYGPGDRDGMLTRLIGLVACGRFVRIGRGENHFHLTYIDDLVRGLVLAGTHSAAPGETFLLAGPHSIAVREMLAQIEHALGLAPHRLYLPETLARPAARAVELLYRTAAAFRLPLPRSGPPVTPTKLNVLCAHRRFSSAKAARLLGYIPRIDYLEGLIATLVWMAEAGLLPTPRGATTAPSSAERPSSSVQSQG
jgi:nucleoside-diphosphate-sugar epimerase